MLQDNWDLPVHYGHPKSAYPLHLPIALESLQIHTGNAMDEGAHRLAGSFTWLLSPSLCLSEELGHFVVFEVHCRVQRCPFTACPSSGMHVSSGLQQ